MISDQALSLFLNDTLPDSLIFVLVLHFVLLGSPFRLIVFTPYFHQSFAFSFVLLHLHPFLLSAHLL